MASSSFTSNNTKEEQVGEESSKLFDQPNMMKNGNLDVTDNDKAAASAPSITIDFASADKESASDKNECSDQQPQPQSLPSDGLSDVDNDIKNDEHVPFNTNPSFHDSRKSAIDLSTERYLPKDTFSFLIFSNTRSKPSLLAGIVFSLQMAIFILVCADVVDPDNRGNPFNLPPNVTAPVRITEVLAICVAIITQDDVRKSINLLRDGYDRDIFHNIFGKDVKRYKWVLSITLRGSEGLLGLFVTFLLIMQSDNVLDLLLNFSVSINFFISIVHFVMHQNSICTMYPLTIRRLWSS